MSELSEIVGSERTAVERQAMLNGWRDRWVETVTACSTVSEWDLSACRDVPGMLEHLDRAAVHKIADVLREPGRTELRVVDKHDLFSDDRHQQRHTRLTILRTDVRPPPANRPVPPFDQGLLDAVESAIPGGIKGGSK